MSAFDFYLVTDTHYFAHKLGCWGNDYEKRMEGEQKCFAETQAINEAAFEWLSQKTDADTVLIAGDLTFNGEKQSHVEFLQLLKALKESGKRILVITAGHDCCENPSCYDETGTHKTPGTKREELFDMYYEYGFSEALAYDRESLSYITQLAPGLRLLALNNDGDRKDNRTFLPRQIEWIKEQTKKAREENQRVIAMNHFPLLPGSPVFSLIGDDAVMKNWREVTDMLADEGVHLCFTGHMHNQSIKTKISAKGNRFTDVCTGSLIGCPAYMRKVSITEDGVVDIVSIPTPPFQWEFNGLTQEEYFRRQFDMMIETYLDCMENDPDRLFRKLQLPDNALLKKFITRAGKKVNHMTVGQACKYFLVKCPEQIKDNSLRQLLLNIVRYAFEGDAPYNYGTPEYTALMGILNRLKPVLNIVKAKVKPHGEPLDIIKLVEDSIGHYGVSDYNATFRI